MQILQRVLVNFTRKDFYNHFRERNLTLCADSNATGNGKGVMLSIDDFRQDIQLHNNGMNFFSFFIPVVILIGIVGNSLSLRVFTSKAMRKMSASYYLAALAMSDMLVLMTYVLLDWLNRGLPRWPGGHSVPLVATQGVCQTFLFFGYTFRLVSVWLIVVFTIERYIGVCRPLHRREMCTKTFAKRAIGSLLLLSSVIASYKPIFCEVKVTEHGSKLCTFKPEFDRPNFILDTIYGLIITAIPFIIISILNMLIVRKLLETRRRHRKAKFLADESVVKLEFTFVLLVISTCFIALNLPYFIVWCQRLHHQLMTSLTPGKLDSETDRIRGRLFITRTIFCINYCTNFFLYALTGRHFRMQLRGVLRCEDPLERRRSLMARTTQITLTTASPRTSLCMTSQGASKEKQID